MGVNTRRPPLPVATDAGSSVDDTSALEVSDVNTSLTAKTDKTSYSIPDDGSPVTIPIPKNKQPGAAAHHARQKSQTSLLIEYFEATKTGTGDRTKPSVRVKVFPSSKKPRAGDGSVQITGIGSDRKPSYTQRITLGNKRPDALAPAAPTDLSASSDGSTRLPVEIEVQHGSDVSNNRSSRELRYAPIESNVSSMPPDSLLEPADSTIQGPNSAISPYVQSVDLDNPHPVAHMDDEETLKVPRRQRSRSVSQERLAQRVAEKVIQDYHDPYRSKGLERSNSNDRYSSNERRRRSSKPHAQEDDAVSGAESSLVSSAVNGSRLSFQSDGGRLSNITNNSRLRELVKDTIQSMILPVITEARKDQGSSGKQQSFDYESGNLSRKLSKHSSSPNIKSKPKVVLNRDGDDPGTVLSRGDSEYRKQRPSSRRSSGRHSREGSYDGDETVRIKSGKDGHRLRDAAAVGAGGAVLTAAALKHHDSLSEGHSRRRRKSSRSRGSHSQSASVADTAEELYGRGKTDIPPLPMASAINDSEVTRESILTSSADNQLSSTGSAGFRTPVREVSRGSLAEGMSAGSSRTPTRTPVARGLGMSHTNLSIESPGNASTKTRKAALAAAGLAAARSASQEYKESVGADEKAPSSARSAVPTRRVLDSPAQSVSSLREGFEDNEALVPRGLRPHSAASRVSTADSTGKKGSQASVHSASPSPSSRRGPSSKPSREAFDEHSQWPRDAFVRGGTRTSTGEIDDDWLEREHELNEHYRETNERTTNRDSYQTNPWPEDARRFTQFTDESQELDARESEQGVHDIASPSVRYVRHSLGAESAVASLLGPSDLTASTVRSSYVDSPTKTNGTYSERMSEHMRSLAKEDAPMYEGSTLSENMTSESRWAQIKGRAINSLSGSSGMSPAQSPSKSMREDQSLRPVSEEVTLGASGVPDVSDPLPEIGHFEESKSDVTTNPSIIQGHLGGENAGKSAWPYTPSPALQHGGDVDDADAGAEESVHSDAMSRDAALLGITAAAGAAALSARQAGRQPTVEEDDDEYGDRYTPANKALDDVIDREATPTSPAAFRDEGYVTNDARSGGALTPKAQQPTYTKEQIEKYNRAMERLDLEGDDPFTSRAKHVRTLSGNSHGMGSPLYDRSTGRGIDRIQSRDVVALMDHLTVRDAQRNARDTEILVTLVRIATEMRESFDDVKRFISEQDRLIMENADRDAERTVQKVLSGPRPHPASPRDRTPRASQEDIQTKRKGVLSRALKGLTRGRSANDLARVEEMLMQILDNVEDLKQHGGAGGAGFDNYADDGLDSYERLRAAPDPGYEPEGRAGTNSTPSHSGQFSVPLTKQQFHSGYNGRRGSGNRVSTVLEGSEEDDLEPHEVRVLGHQHIPGADRYPTPTQERYNASQRTPQGTPTRASAHSKDMTPKAADKHRSKGSTISSVTAAPKVSRWSKTTTSSTAPDPASLESPQFTRKAASDASRSGSTLDRYDDDVYDLKEDDRIRSTQSLAREQARAARKDDARSLRSQASKISRASSPLIPSEAGSLSRQSYEGQREASPVQEDDEAERGFDDPKYQAHRNSLLLQHPQPRQGPTGRHQNTLETQAHMFGDTSQSTTESDVSQRSVSDFDPATWGSAGTAALARNRMSQGTEPMSPISMGSRYGQKPQVNDSLIPQKPSPASVEPEPEAYDYSDEEEEDDDWEPEYSHSGFALDTGRTGYYSSPYGSGHLLEPIEEVRYSMETDSGHISIPPIQRLVGGRRPQDRSLTPEAPASGSGGLGDVRSPARKITGPRPMVSKSPTPQSLEGSGTIRRKPVSRSAGKKTHHRKASQGCRPS